MLERQKVHDDLAYPPGQHVHADLAEKSNDDLAYRTYNNSLMVCLRAEATTRSVASQKTLRTHFREIRKRPRSLSPVGPGHWSRCRGKDFLPQGGSLLTLHWQIGDQRIFHVHPD